MINAIFILAVISVVLPVLVFGIKKFPGDNWQFLASVPRRKNEKGSWSAVNFTYYGVLSASAYVFSVMMFIILTGSLGTGLTGPALLITTLLVICVPASKIVARIVENKPNTLTVGGAVFSGFLAAPWAVAGINHIPGISSLPVIPTLAAITIAYAFGEGTGRLACISFGCCYGKPVSQYSGPFKQLFGRTAFVFAGSTKKIAYESGLEGEKVIPIQGITAFFLTLSGLAGTYHFLSGAYTTAFLEVLILTQAWRAFSEIFRADYRGKGNFSAYQIMALLTILYGAGLSLFFRSELYILPDILKGLKTLWAAEVIVSLEILWAAIFYYTGRSRVTSSTVDFDVLHDQI